MTGARSWGDLGIWGILASAPLYLFFLRSHQQIDSLEWLSVERKVACALGKHHSAFGGIMGDKRELISRTVHSLQGIVPQPDARIGGDSIYLIRGVLLTLLILQHETIIADYRKPGV